MTLFSYIEEEAKISSDLDKLDNLIRPQSSFMDPIQEIQTQLEKIQ